jgi:predicted DNA-binding transcriptional regulator AlpA
VSEYANRRPLLHETQAAKLLGLSPAWLQRKRWEGGGPVYVKHGRAVRYEHAAIEEWIASHRVTPTGEARS